MQRVMDEEKINRLIDAILVMQEQEDTTTPALRSQLAETESALSSDFDGATPVYRLLFYTITCNLQGAEGFS